MRFKKAVLAAVVAAIVVGVLVGPNQFTRTQEQPVLRVGILPIIDALPVLVANQSGLFREVGLKVELISFASALERDSAFTAGRLDGALNDMVTSSLMKHSGQKVAIASVTHDISIYLVSGPSSGVREMQQLAGKSVSISTKTVIEYSTDRMFAKHRVPLTSVKLLNEPKIPLRLQLLLQKSIDAASLPEPAASFAAAKGGSILSNWSAQSVWLFHSDYLAGQPEAVRNFLKAISTAVDRINKNPDAYSGMLIQIARVPPEISGTFMVPTYPKPQKISRELFADVQEWLVMRGYIPSKLDYSDIMKAEALPN